MTDPVKMGMYSGEIEEEYTHALPALDSRTIRVTLPDGNVFETVSPKYVLALEDKILELQRHNGNLKAKVDSQADELKRLRAAIKKLDNRQ